MAISTWTAIRPGSPNPFFGFHIDMVEWLVSADVGLTASVSLIVFSAVTSFITAAAGIGGGIMMVAVMAVLMPAQAVHPVTGVEIGRASCRAQGGRCVSNWVRAVL